MEMGEHVFDEQHEFCQSCDLVQVVFLTRKSLGFTKNNKQTNTPPPTKATTKTQLGNLDLSQNIKILISMISMQNVMLTIQIS